METKRCGISYPLFRLGCHVWREIELEESQSSPPRRPLIPNWIESFALGETSAYEDAVSAKGISLAVMVPPLPSALRITAYLELLYLALQGPEMSIIRSASAYVS